eukprot:299453_1
MSSLLNIIDATIDYVNNFSSLLASQVKYTDSKNTSDENKQILYVLKMAFPTDDESKLVAAFIKNNLLIDSMVAIDTFNNQNKIVAFISTTKVYYKYNDKKYYGLCLAPVATHPQYQQTGIGSKLINTMVNKYNDNNNNCVYMTVLGNHKFYNRFGYVSAYKYGLKCKWEYPKEAFMIQIFNEKSFVAPKVVDYDKNENLILVVHAKEFDLFPGE